MLQLVVYIITVHHMRNGVVALQATTLVITVVPVVVPVVAVHLQVVLQITQQQILAVQQLQLRVLGMMIVDHVVLKLEHVG